MARADQGTTYVVSVAGTKYYGQRSRAEMAVGITGLSTYQTIDIHVPENRLITAPGTATAARWTASRSRSPLRRHASRFGLHLPENAMA